MCPQLPQVVLNPQTPVDSPPCLVMTEDVLTDSDSVLTVLIPEPPYHSVQLADMFSEE